MSGAHQINRHISSFRCLRCSRGYVVDDYFEGCPVCAINGFPSSVVPVYRDLPPSRLGDAWLAYPDAASLGEGNTPLFRTRKLENELGLRRLFVKNEGANPTGSHKDRMSRQIIERALDIGAKNVVAASSGNAGVSLAAYSALAGIGCTIVTTAKMNPNWRRAIEHFGATLVAAETVEQRWTIVAERVRNGHGYPATNFVTPAVGSNPFGVDAYRAIAFELFMDRGEEITDVIVPTSRGDLLWGIAQGYVDLRDAGLLARSPRIHAAEPFARIERVLAGEDYRSTFQGTTKQVSLGGTTVTYQALDALVQTSGTAVMADDNHVCDAQQKLAQSGVYAELSSAACLAGLCRLMEKGEISGDAGVALILTSTGFKDAADFESPIPVFGKDMVPR